MDVKQSLIYLDARKRMITEELDKSRCLQNFNMLK